MRLQARCLCDAPRRFRASFASDAAGARRPGGSAVSSDPTGTMRLQRKWNRDLDARWATIKRMLPQATANSSNPVNMISHSMLTGSHDPVHQFQSWLDEALRQVVVGINGSWLLPYVRQSTDMGAQHAIQSTKDNSPSQTGDPADRTHILQSLAISELQGICEAVSQQLVRAFANSLLRSKNIGTVGAMRNVIDSVGVNRGHMLVSFMCVRGFNAAALDGFRARGVVRVGLVPEKQVSPPVITDAKSKKGMVAVRTAGDERVCDLCQEIADDGPYYIDEAEALIPAHIKCRCAFVPADEEEFAEFTGVDPEDLEDAFNPDQPRDKDGKWTEGGASYSDDEKSHVREYQNGAAINGHLRDLNDPDAPDFVKSIAKQSLDRKQLGALDSAIAKDRLSKETVLYRGVNPVLLKIPAKGQTFKDPAFASTSTDEKIASGFGKIVEIHAPAGTNVLDVSRMLGDKSRYAQGEHILPRDIMYRVEQTEPRIVLRILSSNQTKNDSTTHIAAGVMITADNTGRTLFIRRSGTGDHAGKWAFPAGAVEAGETVEQGAAREAREEIGYDPSDDMEQAHRAETNGVDFTTFMHNTPREFRPHLNHEHDAHKWALVENAPEPLHPGVERTLNEMDQALRMRDEGSAFDPEKHPRDKTGKFTEVGGGSFEYHKNVGNALKELGVSQSGSSNSLSHYKPGEYGHEDDDDSKHIIEAKNSDVDHVLSVVNKHGLMATMVTSEGGYTAYALSQPVVKAPAHTAPPPAHPSEQYLGSVKGNSAERVDLRAKLKSATSASERDELQSKIVASFWKQHDALTKSGKLEQAAEIKGKLQKYAKTYKLDDPTAAPKAPAKVFGKAAPPQPSSVAPAPKAAQAQSASPQEAFKSSLKNAGIVATGGNSASEHVYVPYDQHEQAAEIAKQHPQMKLMEGSATTYVHDPKAPAVVNQEPIDFKSLKKVGEQKGSNPGGVYEDASGNQYYIKTMDRDHAQNEILAAKLYALAGSKTLDYVPVKPDGANHYVATKFEKLDQNNVSQLSPAQKSMAQHDFATHAWLANWDAAGTGGDNQGVKDGVVKTLDVGGSLEYRAKGTPKGAAFGTSVNEFDTLRDPSKNHDAAMLFKPMTDKQIKESVDKLASNVSTVQLQKVVQSVYGPTQKAADLTDKLNTRLKDLKLRAKTLGEAPPAIDLSSMSEEDRNLHVLTKIAGVGAKTYIDQGASDLKKNDDFQMAGMTKEELGFIKAYTGSHYGKINAQLRDGHMNEEVFYFNHVMNDALEKLPAYTANGGVVYRKVDLDPSTIAKYVPGNIVKWDAFTSTAKTEGVWHGNVKFTIHSKTARDVTGISVHGDSEAEAIIPAGAVFKVLKKIGNNIELQEILPPKKKK